MPQQRRSRRKARRKPPPRQRARQKQRDVDDTSALPAGNRRRYVKSKPPKAMPGGRVISSGQGTLTEVSKSVYVAYGSTALGAATQGIHLVVPVKDELQEVTEDDVVATQKTTEEKSKSGFAGCRDPELCFDLAIASLLNATEMVNGEGGGCSFGENVGLDGMMQPCRGSESATSQMNWFSTPPWTSIKSSTVPFIPTPSGNVMSQMPILSDFGMGMFGDACSQVTNGPSLSQGPSPAVSMTEARSVNNPDASNAVRPRNAAPDVSLSQDDDDSYFHLAEELMPETKHPDPPKRPSCSPRYWDSTSPRPRCAPRELVPMMSFCNNPLPPHRFFQSVISWEADTAKLPGPPFSSLSSHQRRYSEITPRPLSTSFYGEQPLFSSHSNLLI